jgi:hypothetical protein
MNIQLHGRSGVHRRIQNRAKRIGKQRLECFILIGACNSENTLG